MADSPMARRAARSKRRAPGTAAGIGRAWGIASALAVGASIAPSHAGPPPADAAPASVAAPPSAPPPPPLPRPELAAHPELPPERRALLVTARGEERIVDAEEAVRAGYTLVDLRDEWTPWIFTELQSDDGAPLPNRYRTIFLGIATDVGDGDGQPLPKNEHNYLELYGIPPTLTVLGRRFLEDAPVAMAPGAVGAARIDRCHEVDLTKLKGLTYIPSREPKIELKERARQDALARDLEMARKKAQLASLEELAALPDARLAEQAKLILRVRQNRAGFIEAEKRLRCEGLFAPRARHKAGFYDDPMREAVIRFQNKHKLYDAAALRPETVATMARPLLDNDHAALLRVLTERVVSAANILEDGSTEMKGEPPPTFPSQSGKELPVRNLVDEALAAIVSQLQLDTPDRALAFFRRHPAQDFQWLRAAIMLPPPPEYYSDAMDLSIEIDRGDVIYDPPFDDNGKPSPLSRHHFPHLTVRTKYRGQLVPLARWRTTIGGWRSDQATNGYEYFRYKGSDVGPRVWRNVVAGPVWIAPNSTPLRALVKVKTVNRVNQTVVNYDEIGPGFLSAYGLVAAYNVVPGKGDKPDWDNGVRVHGSSEILSIRDPNKYSHGCHRLMNHLAERLFSFVLRHRPIVVEGEKPLNFSREFLWKEDVFSLRLPTRGFWYRLEPPVPVNVLEGNIVGKRKKPITGYMPKPGVVYPPGPVPSPSDSPEARAGAD